MGFGVEIEKVGDSALRGGFSDPVFFGDSDVLVEIRVVEFSGNVDVVANGEAPRDAAYEGGGIRALIDYSRPEEYCFRSDIRLRVKRLDAKEKGVNFFERFYGIHAAPNSSKETSMYVSREGGMEKVHVCNAPQSGKIAIVKHNLSKSGKIREAPERL